jgi:hypothetical protein
MKVFCRYMPRATIGAHASIHSTTPATMFYRCANHTCLPQTSHVPLICFDTLRGHDDYLPGVMRDKVGLYHVLTWTGVCPPQTPSWTPLPPKLGVGKARTVPNRNNKIQQAAVLENATPDPGPLIVVFCQCD